MLTSPEEWQVSRPASPAADVRVGPFSQDDAPGVEEGEGEVAAPKLLEESPTHPLYTEGTSAQPAGAVAGAEEEGSEGEVSSEAVMMLPATGVEAAHSGAEIETDPPRHDDGEVTPAQDSDNESTGLPEEGASPVKSPAESPVKLPAELPPKESCAEEEVLDNVAALAVEEEEGSDFGYDMYGGGDEGRGEDEPEPDYDADEADDGADGSESVMSSESGMSSDSEGEHALGVPLQQLQSVLGSPLLPSQNTPAAEEQGQANGEFDAQEGNSADSFDSPFPPEFSEDQDLALGSSLDLSPVFAPSATSEDGVMGAEGQDPDQNGDASVGFNSDNSERTPVAASTARRGLPLPRHPANRSPTSPTVADLIDHFSSPLLARSADRESRRLSRRKDSLYM
jgi:hypothetical protein